MARVNQENLAIRKKMLAKGITIKEVAEAIGMSYGTVCHWMIAPLTDEHRELVLNGIDRVEALKN